MSSRPLRSDREQVAADVTVGELLAADADATADIRRGAWRGNIIDGDLEAAAVNHNPKVVKTHTRLNPELANALTDIATRNSITREQLIREVLAAHAATVLNVPIDPFLRKTQRTGPYYAQRWVGAP